MTETQTDSVYTHQLFISLSLPQFTLSIKSKIRNKHKNVLSERSHQVMHSAGISIDSDKCDNIQRFWNEGIIMVVYEIFFFIFQANLRNKEIVNQHNIAEKYYKIGRSELHWDIWGLVINGSNITHLSPINYIITHMTMLFLIFENLQISGTSLYNP